MRVSLTYNRKGKLNKKGLALVQLRAYDAGTNKYYSTDVHLLPRQWKNDKVVDHPNAQDLNLKLKKLLSDIEAHILHLERSGQPIGFDSIEKFFRYNDLNCFHEFCTTELKEDNAISKATKKHHKVTLGYLREKFPRLQFSDLTYTNIHAFHNFLLGKNLATNTIHGHHRRLKRYINLAIKKDMLEAQRNPYLQFKAKTADTKREVLTPEEITRLEQLELPSEKLSLEIVRDMFLFGCYTGLRFGDIAGLQRSNIFIQGNKTILKIKAQKTKKFLDLPLQVLHSGKPAKLIRKYMKDYKKELLFPGITNQYANRCLKELGALLDTDKKITTHVARHTFATHLALKVKPALLQQLLQHSKIETTMVYVHLSEKMMLEELKRVEW